MKKILLLGNTGQLGWELCRTLAPMGEVFSLDYPQVDFTQPEKIRQLVLKWQPDIVVNAVAYTNVDKAESELGLARVVNATTPGVLAEASQMIGALFVHFSTDYVFDGALGRPYLEEDPTRPLNAYGQTKLEGEELVLQASGSSLIFRTSWVYSLRRSSFVTKVIEWASRNNELRIVDDQVSGPTCARMLAETVSALIARAGHEPYEWFKDQAGLYHLAGSGYASRFDWAKEVLRLHQDGSGQNNTRLTPARSDEFPSPACRPLFSALDCTRFTRTFGLALPDWKMALQMAMDQNPVEWNRAG